MISPQRKRELQQLSMSDAPWMRKSNFQFPQKKKQKIDRSKLFKPEPFEASKTVIL